MDHKTKKMAKSILIIVVVAFVLAGIAAGTAKSSATKIPEDTTAAKKDTIATKVSEPLAASQTIVYYFMTTYRCRSCNFIENTTKAAIEQNFADQIKNGSMVFKTINVDENQNKHFVNKYGLYTKTVVVSSVKNGEELKWKNLDQIWNLIGQDESFKVYIANEIKAFLKL